MVFSPVTLILPDFQKSGDTKYCKQKFQKYEPIPSYALTLLVFSFLLCSHFARKRNKFPSKEINSKMAK